MTRMDRVVADGVKLCLTRVESVYGHYYSIPKFHEILINLEYPNNGTGLSRECLALATYNTSYPVTNTIMTFNKKRYATDYDIEFYSNEIVPHELSHLICFKNNIVDVEGVHGHQWENFCVIMGGSGKGEY